MTAKLKSRAKKTGIGIAMISAIGSCANAYIKIAEQKDHQEKYEIFVSDYQDQINCKLDSLKIKHCNP